MGVDVAYLFLDDNRIGRVTERMSESVAKMSTSLGSLVYLGQLRQYTVQGEFPRYGYNSRGIILNSCSF